MGRRLEQDALLASRSSSLFDRGIQTYSECTFGHPALVLGVAAPLPVDKAQCTKSDRK